tara:strand:- start:3531 stop:3911 length:381 start_codon:yes stop_codon:yes gene_type:complete
MRSIQLNLASIDDLAPYKKEMVQAGLFFAKTTQYFKVLNECGDHIGFTGLMIKSKKARIKNSFVFPNARRLGYFHAIMIESIGICKMLGCTKADAIVTAMSKGWYDKSGWRLIKTYKDFWHYETDL